MADGAAERLVCRNDSATARKAVEHAVRMANRAVGPHLTGITTHVYPDAFSHCGLSSQQGEDGDLR